MWRRNFYNEDWERRKTYLLRSYFEDVPRLSTVQESDESRSLNDFPSLNSRPFRDRPESPLPELIIERVPKCNRHDEPEEFYEKLQVTIQNYVDKLKGQKSPDSRATDVSDTSVAMNNDSIRSSLLERSRESNVDSGNKDMNADNAQDSHSDEISTSEELQYFDVNSDDHDENVYDQQNFIEKEKSSNEYYESEDELIQSVIDGPSKINSPSTTKLHFNEGETTLHEAEVLHLERPNYFRLYYADTTEDDTNITNKTRTDDRNVDKDSNVSLLASEAANNISMEGRISESRTSSNKSDESYYEMVSHQIEVDVHAEQSMNKNQPASILKNTDSSSQQEGPEIMRAQTVNTSVSSFVFNKENEPESNPKNIESSIQQEGPEIMRAHNVNTSVSSTKEAKKRRANTPNIVNSDECSYYWENVADKAFVEESMTFTSETQTVRFSTLPGLSPVSLPSSPKKRIIGPNVGVQTENLDRNIVDWNNFFIGTPTIYKLHRM